MTARRQIAFGDIRPGDTIEQEYVDKGVVLTARGVVNSIYSSGLVAGSRQTSEMFGDAKRLATADNVCWFLIYRPIPVVDRLEQRLAGLDDEGYQLVRFYGDYCGTCGTQSQASVLAVRPIIDEVLGDRA